MKHIFKVLCAMALVFTFTSCEEKEDTGVEVNVNKIAGAWKSVQHEGNVNGRDTVMAEPVIYLVMRENMTGYVYTEGNTVTFDYEISGSNVKIKNLNGLGDFGGLGVISYSVEELSERSLTISGSTMPGDPTMQGNTGDYKGHYVRISESDIPNDTVASSISNMEITNDSTTMYAYWDFTYDGQVVNCYTIFHFNESGVCDGAYGYINLGENMVTVQGLLPTIVPIITRLLGDPQNYDEYNLDEYAYGFDLSAAFEGKTRDQIIAALRAL